MRNLKDHAAAWALRGCRSLLQYAANAPRESSAVGRALGELGIAIYERNYYHPFISRADLSMPLSQPRVLPGVALDADRHLSFLRSLRGLGELADIPDHEAVKGEFYFANGAYQWGDADVLYGILRTFKPKRVIEIGSGQSTKLAKRALDKNRGEDPARVCQHTCIEPYEMPWLAEYGVDHRRLKAEQCDPAMFLELEADDVLFIDSSHVIRPQGDVVFEFLQLLPTLAPGVFVHVHDIFTPRDYPEAWVLDRGVLWDEQYLLEAFLSMNSAYEVLAPMNWLATAHTDELAAVLPAFARQPGAQPGAFWIRRKSAQ